MNRELANLNLQATHFTGKESVDLSSCWKIVALERERFSLVEGNKIQPNCRSGIGCVPKGGGGGGGVMVVRGNVNHLQERPPLCPKPLPKISRKTRLKLLAFKENCIVSWCCGWVRTPNEIIQFYQHVPPNKSEPIMVSAIPRNTRKISVIL